MKTSMTAPNPPNQLNPLNFLSLRLQVTLKAHQVPQIAKLGLELLLSLKNKLPKFLFLLPTMEVVP